MTATGVTYADVDGRRRPMGGPSWRAGPSVDDDGMEPLHRVAAQFARQAGVPVVDRSPESGWGRFLVVMGLRRPVRRLPEERT